MTDEKQFNADGSPMVDPVGADKIEKTCGASTLPKVSFDTLVASLNASALLSMGALQDPSGQGMPKDLEMARYTIDLLEMLEEKTKGNLNKDEAEILKHVLYDLRMLYVKEKRC